VRAYVLAVALAASACRGATEFGKEAVWATPKRGAVVSEHPLATEVGLAILEDDGNAADAAVATALALAVVYPQRAISAAAVSRCTCRTPEPRARSTSARRRRRRRTVRSTSTRADGSSPKRSLVGPLSVAVPGSPAGLESLLEKPDQVISRWRSCAGPRSSWRATDSKSTPGWRAISPHRA
jgi:gamma-glutamyltranspeptidase/glutathione hydrolase